MVEWQETTLGELCAAGGGDIQTGPFGSQLHASDYVAHGIPSVMPQNIGDNVIVEDGIARIRASDANRLARYLLKPGDIVYSRRGDVERRALVRNHQDGWLCGTGCLRVRLGSGADSQFMSYYLGDPEVRIWIVRHAIGATMPNLNTKILSAVPIKIPEPQYQRAIGAALGALDDKIAVNERIAETARWLALASAQEQVGQSSGRDVKLGDCAEITKGVSYRSTDLTPGNGWLVTLKCVDRDGSFRANGMKPYNGDCKESQVVEPGDVVVAQTDLTQRAEVIGKPTRVEQGSGPGRLVASLDLAVVRPREGLSNEFLLGLLSTQEFRDHALAYCNGTTVLHLGARALPEFRFAKPDGATVNRITAVMKPLLQQSDLARREVVALASLRGTLLPKLMSGELRVRDAERAVEEAT